MAERKIRGIVIDSKDFKEKDKHLSIFSLEEGIVCGVLKGVKNANAKMKFAKEPFCFAEFILQGEGDFSVISSAEIIENFYDLTQDYQKFELGCKILQSIHIVLSKGQVDQNLFLLVIKALRELTYGESDSIYCFVSYLIKLLSLQGFRLIFDRCNSCGMPLVGRRYLNVSTGEIVDLACRDNACFEISHGVHSVFKVLCNTSFESLNTIRLPQENLHEAIKILETIFDIRFGKTIKIE